MRIKNNIKQKTMSKTLNMTVAAYSRKENGQRSFTIDEVAKIAEFFKISMEELIF
ncbi:helix-turn-helix transcriptional regulator [Clostridiaceae bacterium UIB06]|uniref:Helix-turn-helix transcriptional regulator n=1 Tax=Clostridium thailandense TaxID=2794346 RepID=A0A949TJE1_9CLOT|nr:helix-turn-helix transcriptional regulator [Clostridium thailandense]MCH5136408.1 helix-turn-helix transcriptional regulator [Clostridiaceae bacterium UIB06]